MDYELVDELQRRTQPAFRMCIYCLLRYALFFLWGSSVGEFLHAPHMANSIGKLARLARLEATLSPLVSHL